jgi:hypothetical protein
MIGGGGVDGSAVLHAHVERNKCLVESEDVRFGNCEIPIQHVQELALNTPDVAFAKNARDECPMDVFQCRVIRILIHTIDKQTRSKKWEKERDEPC